MWDLDDLETAQRYALAPSAVADLANVMLLGSPADESLIMRTIKRLAWNPYLGQQSLALRPIYRRYVCGDYQVVYRLQRGTPNPIVRIVVVAIRGRDEELDGTL